MMRSLSLIGFGKFLKWEAIYNMKLYVESLLFKYVQSQLNFNSLFSVIFEGIFILFCICLL